MEIINGYNSNNRIEYYDRFSINLSLYNMGNMERIPTMREYNGHRSWNAWNVALWLSNEYNLYQEIVDRVKKNGLTKAVNMMYRDIGGYKTPDGAIYNKLSIRLAIEGMEIEDD